MVFPLLDPLLTHLFNTSSGIFTCTLSKEVHEESFVQYRDVLEVIFLDSTHSSLAAVAFI